MTVWKYIDKSAATVAVLRDYPDMREIVDMTPDDICDEYEKMFVLRTPNNDGMPHVHNPHAGENLIVNTLDKLDVALERYREAREYLDWFEPAWDYLDEQQRTILREFYMTDNQKSGATVRLMHWLHRSENSIDRDRSKALRRLSLLLFGWKEKP